MGKYYDIEDGIYGPSMVVKGKWNEFHRRSLERRKIYELQLNTAKGWVGRKVDFLKDLGFLKAVSITGIGTPVKDDSGVHHLNKLKYLSIHTYCKNQIDFSCFPNLECCVFEWRPRSESLFQCTKLKDLWINCYKKRDTEEFKSLPKLESLGFGNGPIASLKGLSSLTRLRELEIWGLRKLNSLDGLEKLKNLEKLEIGICKHFKSIEKVSHLNKLKFFYLDNCGEIESLRPLLKNKNLEVFLMVESTNILDGDMTPLLKLKKIKKAFSGPVRKHYSHRIDIDENKHEVETLGKQKA